MLTTPGLGGALAIGSHGSGYGGGNGMSRVLSGMSRAIYHPHLARYVSSIGTE